MDARCRVPRINQRRHDHANDNGNRQIFKYGHDSHHHHHQRVRFRDFQHDPEGVPRECADHHHEHHPDQRGNGNLFNQPRSKQDKAQQEQRRRDTGNARAAARFYIDHGLPDHGTAAHAAKKSGDNIGRALSDTFL